MKHTSIMLFVSLLCSVFSACTSSESPVGLAEDGSLSATSGYRESINIASSGSNQCTVAPEGILHWWPGDSNSDDIIGGNNGTLGNGTTFSSGLIESAFLFDGLDDYISASPPPYTEGDSYSYEFWFKNDVNCDDSKQGTLVHIGRELQIDRSFNTCDHVGTVFSKNGSGNGLHDLLSGFPRPTPFYTPGIWNHVAVTFDGTSPGTLSYYLNGVLTASTNSPTPPSRFDDCVVSNPRELIFGRRPLVCTAQTRHFDGLIDEFAIYGRVLSESEIQSLFNAGSAGKCKSISVEVDIKPGSETNPVNLKSKGNIPVAILTTPSFDASMIDPLTIQFGPSGAYESHHQGHIEDVDGDGDNDMILHFNTQETGIEEGEIEACLSGSTLSGESVEGCDNIQTL